MSKTVICIIAGFLVVAAALGAAAYTNNQYKATDTKTSDGKTQFIKA